MRRTVPISCPGCAGVLSAVTHGDRYEDYVCQVGHAYALADLLAAKEHEVERALWSAIVLLEHVELVIGRLTKQQRDTPTEAALTALDQRRREARNHGRILRDVIEQTTLVPVN